MLANKFCVNDTQHTRIIFCCAVALIISETMYYNIWAAVGKILSKINEYFEMRVFIFTWWRMVPFPLSQNYYCTIARDACTRNFRLCKSVLQVLADWTIRSSTDKTSFNRSYFVIEFFYFVWMRLCVFVWVVCVLGCMGCKLLLLLLFNAFNKKCQHVIYF